MAYLAVRAKKCLLYTQQEIRTLKGALITMSQTLLIDLSGYLGGFFLMLSFLPQLYKSWKTKSTEDLSWGLLWITLASAICYQVYAVLLELNPVVVMNGIFMALVLLQIKLKYYYEHPNNSLADK